MNKKTNLFNEVKSTKYKVKFTGRQVGAEGAKQHFTVFVNTSAVFRDTADRDAFVIASLYDRYEHISEPKVEEVKDRSVIVRRKDNYWQVDFCENGAMIESHLYSEPNRLRLVSVDAMTDASNWCAGLNFNDAPGWTKIEGGKESI